MITDALAYGINIYVESQRLENIRKRKRADRFGGMVSLLILSATTIWLLADAIQRLLAPKEESSVDGKLMFIFTGFNIIADFYLFYLMSQEGSSGTSMNMKSAVLHLGADLLRGIAVVFVGIWIYVKHTHGVVMDAVCSIFVSVFILIGALQLASELLRAGINAIQGEEVNIEFEEFHYTDSDVEAIGKTGPKEAELDSDDENYVRIGGRTEGSPKEKSPQVNIISKSSQPPETSFSQYVAEYSEGMYPKNNQDSVDSKESNLFAIE